MTGPGAVMARGVRGQLPARIAVAVGVLTLWVEALQVNARLWDRLVYDWLGLDVDDRLGSAVHFFFYDTVKIALLLVGIIFAVSAGVPLGVTLSFLIASPVRGRRTDHRRRRRPRSHALGALGERRGPEGSRTTPPSPATGS